MPNVIPSIYYDMSNQKYLCIFNHEYFEDTVHFQSIGIEYLSRRVGTRLDVENLTKTFTNLGYKVAVYSDLRHEKIISTLASFCQSDHSDTSCIVVAILTHGRGSNELMAADKPYRLTEICNILHNGKLTGKPKILFVQACRQGHLEDASYSYPTPPDFLIMHASVADYVSFRVKEEGSFLINAICDVLKDLTDERGTVKRLTYADFVTTVNQKVASISTKSGNPDFNNKKQIPETTITFLKSLVFWPNNRG